MVSGRSRKRTNEAIIRRNLQGFDGESARSELLFFRQILFHCVPLKCAKALTKQEGQKRLLGCSSVRLMDVGGSWRLASITEDRSNGRWHNRFRRVILREV